MEIIQIQSHVLVQVLMKHIHLITLIKLLIANLITYIKRSIKKN